MRPGCGVAARVCRPPRLCPLLLGVFVSAIPGPEPAPAYASAEYWEARYALESEQHRTFEWYGLEESLDGRSLFGAIAARLPSSGRVLVVGCGNSALSAHLAASGLEVVSVDVAGSVVAAMRLRYPTMRWVQARTTSRGVGHPGQAGV